MLVVRSLHPPAHLVPHTHLDPGWLNTFDAYFYSQGVGIHEGVALSLARDPDRRFTLGDVAFFVRWLEEKGRYTVTFIRIVCFEWSC
jgi:hypothetical protein